MNKVLQIEEEDFFNPQKIKVFDGIAGSGKSSKCAEILNKARIKFLRCTSTNKLKKDASNRFGGENVTIAGGLFKTVNGVFYYEDKEIEFDTVLIDEALQADRRVFEWCNKNVGKVNIIICTDSMQMLPPNTGDGLINYFKEFCNQENVIYRHLTDTLRPKDEETKKIYTECYEAVNENYKLYNKYKKEMKIENIDNIEYNTEDAFICHTNEIEKFLYVRWNLQNRYELPLIPKGNIASKENIDFMKYPIVPQADVKKITNYLQVENVGTVSRYQGSEVEVGHKLYYFVEKRSSVENREFYTMITRAKRFQDIRLVYVDPPKTSELTSFDGKPIIPKVFENISRDTVCNDSGDTIGKLIDEGYSIQDSHKEFILENINKKHENEKVVNFYVDGETLHYDRETKGQTTMASLIKREPLLHCDFMDEFYSLIDEIQQKDDPVYVHRHNIWTPVNVDKAGAQKGKDAFQYGIDLYSSYPHCFRYGDLPDGREFWSYKVLSEEEAKKQDLIRFYMNRSEYGNRGAIFTNKIVDFIRQNAKKEQNFVYIGACKKLTTHKIGDWLITKAYRSYETKQKLKNIHYGYLQKPYIEPAFYDENGKVKSFIKNENQDLELLMVCIQSEQALKIMQIKMMIYGTLDEGRQLVDCLYFDTKEDLQSLGEVIHFVLGAYDFRIFKNEKKGKTEEKEIIYQTYKTLEKKG